MLNRFRGWFVGFANDIHMVFIRIWKKRKTYQQQQQQEDEEEKEKWNAMKKEIETQQTTGLYSGNSFDSIVFVWFLFLLSSLSSILS